MLEEKIEHSLSLIKKAEKLALAMQSDMGFHVGFSGGKDSQVVLELVRMAGVKYKAVYNVTTNDPADNVRFIKNHYPGVEFSVPKESYFQLVAKKGLPTMFNRWCCALFKEAAGTGFVVLTGVRREESSKRAAYDEIAKWGKNKQGKEEIDLDKMEENKFQCVGGRDKFMVYPILEWTEEDVWAFIRERNLSINPCYESHKRVGCVFCPFARSKEIRAYCETHPRLKASFIHAIERYMERAGEKGKLPTAEDYFEWWLSHEALDVYIDKKRQLKMEL